MNNFEYNLTDSPKAVKITIGVFVIVMLWLVYMITPSSSSIDTSQVEQAFIKKIENENTQAKKMFGPLMKKDANVKVIDVDVQECKEQGINQLCTLHATVHLGKDKTEKRLVELLIKTENNNIKVLTSSHTQMKQ